MFLVKRHFQSSTVLEARFPALPTRISRKSNLKNQKHIEKIKQKLGDKYRMIGRDKRKSPFTERKSPSKPTQPPKPVDLEALVKPFLYQQGKVPMDLKPGNLQENLNSVQTLTETEKQKTTEKQSLLMPKIKKKQEVELTNEFTRLSLPENAIPTAEEKDGVELKTAHGPFYQYGVTPSDLEYLLETIPSQTNEPYNLNQDSQQQAEMIRRILALENGNQKNIKKFNIQRVVEMFQRNAFDTGSSEVQAAVMMVKINDMKAHLTKYPKDKSTKRRLEAWISKQKAILKYLKRQDLKKFVLTCEAIGLEPF